jgi:hypothetical protein
VSQRQLNVIYCDDVRQEVGNKQSFIGVYAADLIVDRLPAILPKFCVVATVSTPLAQPFDNLRVRVLMDEQCVFDTQEIVMTTAEGAQAIGEPKTAAERAGDMQANIVMVLSPLQIDNETTLQVVADVDGESMRSRLLRVTQRGAPHV